MGVGDGFRAVGASGGLAVDASGGIAVGASGGTAIGVSGGTAVGASRGTEIAAGVGGERRKLYSLLSLSLSLVSGLLGHFYSGHRPLVTCRGSVYLTELLILGVKRMKVGENHINSWCQGSTYCAKN